MITSFSFRIVKFLLAAVMKKNINMQTMGEHVWGSIFGFQMGGSGGGGLNIQYLQAKSILPKLKTHVCS